MIPSQVSRNGAGAGFQLDQRIGRYTLVARLGRGGMGEVWEATGPDGPVALKLPRRPAFVRHLRREGVLLGEVNHPYVATLYEASVEGEVPYLAMELVRGTPLRALCDGELSMSRITLLCDKILQGLDAIHQAGLLHLDLKPENIIVTPEGLPRIVDLGLGRATGKVLGEAYLSVSLVSRAQPLAGTLAYMAPEQRDGREVDVRTDLYAFGMILHELCAGELPRPGRHLQDRREGLSKRWDVIVSRLTHPDRARRPASANETRLLISFTLADKPATPFELRAGASESVTRYDDEVLSLASPFLAGDMVGGYELERPLGRGGFAEVWAGRRGGERRALKIATSGGGREALAIEAKLLRQVQGAFVPRLVRDASRERPSHLVMELLQGESLRKILVEAGGPLPYARAARLTAGMLRAVAGCHRAGVVHGDLKPEHFLVTEQEPSDAPGEEEARGQARRPPKEAERAPHAVLIDFGFGRAPGGALRPSLASAPAVGGTPDYLAPEVGRQAPSVRSDVYSLGVCFFEMLTGALPRGPQSANELNPEVPLDLSLVLSRMLSRLPEERPGLDLVACELAPTERPVRRWTFPRRSGDKAPFWGRWLAWFLLGAGPEESFSGLVVVVFVIFALIARFAGC